MGPAGASPVPFLRISSKEKIREPELIYLSIKKQSLQDLGLLKTKSLGLFLDLEPEGTQTSHPQGLALTRFSGNAKMPDPDGEESRLFLSSSPSG